VFLGNVEGRRRAIDAGVVHEGINPAELAERLLDHRPEIIAGRDIRPHYKRATAEATQFRRSAIGVRPIQLSHHDVRAHARQFRCGGTADTTASSGDYGNLSLQFHMTFLSRSGPPLGLADPRMAPRISSTSCSKLGTRSDGKKRGPNLIGINSA
jgi:hypothetical protein